MTRFDDASTKPSKERNSERHDLPSFLGLEQMVLEVLSAITLGSSGLSDCVMRIIQNRV